MSKTIWELEEEVRTQLRDFSSGSHALAISGLDDAVKWAELKRGQLTVIYIKGMAKVTVHARVDDKVMEITSVSLDHICWGLHD
jgi:hypothetical protein